MTYRDRLASLDLLDREYVRDEKGQFAGTGGGLTSSSDSNIIDGQKETTKATAIPTVPYRATPKPDDFIAARNLSTRPGFLSPLTEGDLTGHKLFLSEDGKVGGALSKDGDIGNVFNNGGPPGAARTIMLDMVKAGGKTLDAFDGYLPKLYANFGMEETGRMKFNPDYAPPGWDYDRHDNPDVVFMARTEQAAEKAGSFDDIRQRVNPSNDKTRAGWITHEKSTQYYDDYDRAKSDALSRAQSGRARSLSVAGAGVRQGVGGETGGAGAGRSPRVGRSLALLLDWDEAQHPRDERGRFGGGSGSGDLTPGEQALQTRLVDFKVDRNLTGPRSQAITESVPGSSFSQYVKVPGLDAMHAAMGVTPTLETNPLAYQASRDAMFAKQPEATIPFDKLTFTQPRINRDRVESLKTAEAQLNKPVQILKHGDNFYVMNGHHRAVAAYAAGRSGLKGHVFDTAQHLSAEVAVYEAARLLLLREYVRDDHGQFADTEGEGKADKLAAIIAKAPRVGKKGIAGDILYSPKDALDSLLLHEKGVNIDRADVRKFLEKAGKQLEDPDLTDLHVDGMQIFGGNGLGIARKDMPQIPKEMREDFLRDVKTAGIDVKLEKVSPLSLAPTQKEISARLAAEKLDKYERDPKRAFPPILVDKSNHVLDGHHHWGMAAAVSIDHPDLKIPVYRIMTDNVKARGLMTAFDRKHGITGKDTGLSWDEGALTDRDLFLLTRLPDDEEVINLPFAEYEDFADCVDQNQDKDDPEAFCGWLKHRIEGAIYPGARYAVVNLPDVADVNFPSLIGAIPAKPPTKKRRKRYIFKGVSLSRKPLNFEVQILALTAIPRRLDLARDTILADRDDGLLRATMEEIAQYGADEVMRELQRQGAPRQSAPMVTIDTAYETFIADRDRALKDLRGNYEYRLCRRRISASRRDVLVTMLTGGREPGLRRRFANRAINEMFALGRGLSISVVRRRKLAVEYALAKHHDDEDDGDGPYQDETGQFISKADAIAGGDITVDAIVQTAIMDTATCDACSEVDGEVMDLGSDRQEELHPPYVMCEGGDACRCVQIALLSDGTEMDVDEIDEDTLPDSAEDDF